MSTHNMFLWRNKKDIGIFQMKKVPYLLLSRYFSYLKLLWILFSLLLLPSVVVSAGPSYSSTPESTQRFSKTTQLSFPSSSQSAPWLVTQMSSHQYSIREKQISLFCSSFNKVLCWMSISNKKNLIKTAIYNFFKLMLSCLYIGMVLSVVISIVECPLKTLLLFS